MSIGTVIEATQQWLSGGAERSLVLAADKDFASSLTLGQIIKGKVMRHYEGGRYGVNFNGQEKVVDSTFPMQRGDVIFARVTGIDEKVHLQRVVASPSQGEEGPLIRDRAALNHGLFENNDSIRQLFDRYQAKLTASEHLLLQKLQHTLGGARHVAVSALILSKIGVTLDPGLIKTIHRVLQDLPADHGMATRGSSSFSVSDAVEGPGGTGIEALALLLSRLSDKGPATPLNESALSESHPSPTDDHLMDASLPDSQMGQEEHRDQLEWFLGQWLLNAQSEGAVAHRFLRIPLWFNNELVEVTLSVFAQKESGPNPDSGSPEPLRYRKVVFALDTDELGHMEIQAKLADRHVRIEVVADTEAAAEYLGSSTMLLKSALAIDGWHVDEVTYSAKSNPQGPLQAVVEHYIAQDSLNRLF